MRWQAILYHSDKRLQLIYICIHTHIILKVRKFLSSTPHSLSVSPFPTPIPLGPSLSPLSICHSVNMPSVNSLELQNLCWSRTTHVMAWPPEPVRIMTWHTCGHVARVPPLLRSQQVSTIAIHLSWVNFSYRINPLLHLTFIMGFGIYLI